MPGKRVRCPRCRVRRAHAIIGCRGSVKDMKKAPFRVQWRLPADSTPVRSAKHDGTAKLRHLFRRRESCGAQRAYSAVSAVSCAQGARNRRLQGFGQRHEKSTLSGAVAPARGLDPRKECEARRHSEVAASVPQAGVLRGATSVQCGVRSVVCARRTQSPIAGVRSKT